MQHRRHRAELDHRGERGAGVLPAHEGGDDPQVRGARNGQELGEALDDAQDDGLNRIHGCRTVAAPSGPQPERGTRVQIMSTGTIESRSPQDQSDVVVSAPAADREDVAAAFKKAREAAREWSRSALARADALSAAAAALDAAKDQVVELMVREVGKPLTESVMEHGRAVRILRYQAQSALDPDGDTYPTAPPADMRTLLMSRRRPRGVAGLITPWNFPFAIPLWKAAPALCYGNTVVLKPASRRDRVRAVPRGGAQQAPARGRVQRRHRAGLGRAGRRRAGRRRLVHGLDRRRAGRGRGRDRARDRLPGRDGRAERLDRAPGRRRRGRGEGDRGRGDGLRRPEVHGDRPRDRPRRHQGVHRGARRRRGGAAGG